MRRLLLTCLLVVLLQPRAPAQTAQLNLLVIKGQVVDEQGHPVSGAYVVANPDSGLRGKVLSASSGSRGEFSIAVYKLDSFKVSASKPADGYPPSSIPFYYPTEEALAHVSVMGGREAPFATIRLGPKAGNITGRVIDAETGQAVDDFQITLCRAEVPKFCHRQSTRSSGGRFSMLVPAAPFTIQISASGYEDWYGPDRQPVSVQVSSGTTIELNVSLARGDSAQPAVLGSPQALSPSDGAELNHYPRITRLEWSAVSGAASYTVELEVCQLEIEGKECGQLLQIRGNPPLSGIDGTSYEFLFIGAQPGRWRVWAVDAKGRVGTKSPWSKFIYRQ